MTQATVPFRIGEGWDVHALVPGRPLIIGGVTIPHSVGLPGREPHVAHAGHAHREPGPAPGAALAG